MKTLFEVLHIYIWCTIYIGLYRLSGSLLLLMRQFRVSYSRPSTGLPQGVALLSRDLSPGAPSVTELQFRILICCAHLHFRYCLIWLNDLCLWSVHVHVCTYCFRMRLTYDLAHITCYFVFLWCAREGFYGFLTTLNWTWTSQQFALFRLYSF